MGSIGISALDNLRKKTQVDWDCLDLEGVSDNGLYVDVTSNQFEVFDNIIKPQNAAMVERSREMARSLKSKFPEVRIEQLAFDVVAVILATRIAPYVSGNVHLMADPRVSFSTEQVVAQCKRFHSLCTLIDAGFDHTNRLVMKVACTWEAMQAARSLRAEGLKCLATTVFSMEQVILAGEAGCVSISPFVYELKDLMDEEYVGGSPSIAQLCVDAQRYYKAHGIPTKVKACATKALDEIIALDGVDAFTMMPSDATELAALLHDPSQTAPTGLFSAEGLSSKTPGKGEYIDNEAKYRIEFAKAQGGLAQFKLMQSMAIFADYQDKGEYYFSEKRSNGVKAG